MLLLDEVLTGLTPIEAQTGVELVRKVRATGVTVLMVEHVMEIVMPLVDRAIVLDLGKVLVEGQTCGTSCAIRKSSAPILGIVMLSVHEVTTAYQGLVALSAVSIEVAKGEIVCVAGANGAGKSTLIKSIAGAERPRSGSVTFDGARIDGLSQHMITARGIAYVPENRRLFPRLSVRDNLRLGSYLYRGQTDREAPLALVFKLFPRLSERLEQRAETLSGGEQQMLAIGRALMTRPRLLMLDEPSQGIMPKLVDEIFQAVKQIRGRRNDGIDRRAAHRGMSRDC